MLKLRFEPMGTYEQHKDKKLYQLYFRNVDFWIRTITNVTFLQLN